ncbi:hypothetical protein K435DRAFT_755662 [Dendrothele bispora CBS 962.96]|uniref:SH3 domain-containing protein n=1 Tax=Dendrothele bispora (strain CBS 962.96) TaxID=1314807 RepID=A0A4V4HFM0_DENBC|nr:hypothetical protein K435DRAFT_755662 [Dendrothele bispora CBS 962.96]
MGTVGLAGAFAGLDLFQNNSFTFNPETSTLLSRSTSGSLTVLASTNTGGRIAAGCSLDDTFYFAGSFSSIGSTSASNVASYSSSGSFSALGSNGPNGEIDSIFCDTKGRKVWVGGKFSLPGSSVAVWDPEANSWSRAPFTGVAGAQNRVLSITSNSSASSLFFAGSFVTSFGGTVLNGTNNPKVPFSAGATPFSSSLVPVPLGDAEVEGQPSTSDSQFSNIKNILCPAGNDGPGNSWFGGDGSTAVVTVRKFSFLSASGIRLGNTFLSNHGTTGFSVTTLPDNTVRQLTYLDPTTNQNVTCTDPCPLLTDSTIPYQDFLFDQSLEITGVQIALSQFTGNAPGLHLLQLLSSGAFASAVNNSNGQSCFAPNPSNVTLTGSWTETQANTNISGTIQSILVADVAVGTPASQSPSVRWQPYVSAAGNYEVRMLIPGCANNCGARTSVGVEVFPGGSLDPTTSTVDQNRAEDASVVIYSGPILPSSPDFVMIVMTVTMTLADNPTGNGENGQYEIVADRIELALLSANVSSDASGSSGTGTASVSGNAAFGFLEWPLAADGGVDATKGLSNSSQTSLDTAGIDIFAGLGGSSSISSSSPVIASVAHHSSGAIFLGGNFTLSSGDASGSSNVVVFKNGALSSLANNGLNGGVTSLVIDGDRVFVGGSFQDTTSASTNGQLKNIALYNIGNNQWSALGGGVDGRVTSLSVSDGQVQVVGNFSRVFTSSSDSSGLDAPGFATWDINNSRWVNTGGFLVGSMSMVTNGSDSTQFLAGNVVSSRSFGASGMVMLKNSDSDIPDVTPLSFQLEGTSSSSSSSGNSRRRIHIPRASSWMSHVRLSHLFSKRQSSSGSSPSALPDPLPAPAPAVLAGAFWTNSSSSKEVAIIGGNFSFVPSGSSSQASGVALYDQDDTTLTALQGSQINGTVRTLLVDGNSLYIGGEFTVTGTSVNGFAIYDLQNQQWSIDGLQALQDSSGSPVVVRSITKSSDQANVVYVAGSFAQAGQLACQAICSLNTQNMQWNQLGNGIKGEVASVAYGGNNQEFLYASGSIQTSGGTAANVMQFMFSNASWNAVGSGSDIPGPVTALEVNNANTNSIFAAGRTTDGSAFLTFFNGANWTTLASSSGDTVVSQLTMVPLQNTHEGNNVVESDRMLMVSGNLDDSQFGNASSALFDGQTFIPYVVSSSSSGSSGSVSSLFRSFQTFSFAQRHFLATGVVILISIAIAAGVVFLLALIGILWTLFSRRDRKDKLNQVDGQEDDDDSIRHRPSSLLEHVNAATRSTIMAGGIGAGVGAATAYSDQEEKMGGEEHHDVHEDPYGPDASNYLRAETPSDAFAGGLGTEEASRPARARFSFDGAGEGELPLSAGAEVEVLDDRDQSWWYARDVRTGQEGVVPSAYLY